MKIPVQLAKTVLAFTIASVVGPSVKADPRATTAPAKDKAQDSAQTLSEVVVDSETGKPKFPNTTKATPSLTVNRADIETKVNEVTIEDALRYLPGVNVRRR